MARVNPKEGIYKVFHPSASPLGTLGCMMRMDPPYPHACGKRRLKGGSFSKNRKIGFLSVLGRARKRTYEMSMAWELDPKVALAISYYVKN